MLKKEINDIVFFEQYNKIINDFYNNDLKEKLVDVFISYYGVQYSHKIRYVIDNLGIVRMNTNLGISGFEEKVNLYLNKLKDKISELKFDIDNSYLDDIVHFSIKDIELLFDKSMVDISSVDKMLVKKYFYLIKYYSSLIEFNSDLESIVVDSNIDESWLKFVVSDEKLDDDVSGYAVMEYNERYVFVMNGFGIDLHGVIHEINHLLSKELLAYNEEKESFEIHYGFRTDADLFYEIINDCMSVEIYDELSSKISEDWNFIIDRKVGSSYLQVDYICENFVKKVYDKYKVLIKECLINGNGNKFIKILGRKNYVNINFTLSCVLNDMRNFFDSNPDASRSDFVINDDYKNLFNGYLELIDFCFNQYNEYNNNLDENLKELEHNGSIRRI